MTSNRPVSFFRAEIKHLEALIPIFDDYRGFYNLNSDMTQAQKFLSDRMNTRDSVIFASCPTDEPTRIVGFTQLYPSFSSLSMKKNWILYDLFVAPDFRGHQIATSLLNIAMEFAKSSGADGLTLKTAVGNLPAQNLYESLGWKRDQEFFSYDFHF